MALEPEAQQDEAHRHGRRGFNLRGSGELAVAGTGGFAHLDTHELFTADQLAPLTAKAKAARGGYKAPGA